MKYFINIADKAKAINKAESQGNNNSKIQYFSFKILTDIDCMTAP